MNDDAALRGMHSLFLRLFFGGGRQILLSGRTQVLVQADLALGVNREARLLPEADEEPVHLEPLLPRQPLLQRLARRLGRLGAALAGPAQAVADAVDVGVNAWSDARLNNP